MEEVAAGGGQVRLRFFVEAASADDLLEAARRAWPEDGSPPPRLVPVVERPWVEEYQRGLRPFRLGRRFWVVPGEEDVAAAESNVGRSVVRLVPGRAFGTGEHATTRLCVEALERRVEPGSAWVDLGTGSGILAVIAARLGAARVLALDVDADAVAVAREAVARNGASTVVRVEAGSLGPQVAGYDGLVANVSSAFFLREAGRLAAAIRPGGWAIVSGVPEAEADEVGAALAAAGLEPDGRWSDDGWVVLEAGR